MESRIGFGPGSPCEPELVMFESELWLESRVGVNMGVHMSWRWWLKVSYGWSHNSIVFFFFLISLLYNIVLVLPFIDMNQPWVYMCSPS